MKRRIPTHKQYLAVVIALIGAIGFSFTNCSKVAFEAANEAPSLVGDSGAPEPRYATLKAGDAANFPPLKLIFVVDNSGTMGVNQINLSSAFSKMFEGDNATNLAPFATTAFLFNTAQRSALASDAIYPKVSKRDLAYFSQFSLSQINNGPRASLLDGSVPGDLVGYSVRNTTSSDGLKSLEYLPAPVAAFETIGGNTVPVVSIRRNAGSSVTGFAQEFRDRIAILDPQRSMIDPATKAGILDPIIDKESGLCALARMMKHNGGYVEPGDAAAFIIVSDENDADPSGTNCIDSVVDVKGDQDLVDVRCDQPRTQLSFREDVVNPQIAKCVIKYDTGFKFKYVYAQPQTDVSYYVEKYKYALKRTEIKFSNALRSYATKQTKISFEKKAPTYEIAQTKVSYFKEVEDCEMRDGIKVNCTYTYPAGSGVFDGDPNGSCVAYSSGKIPNDALKTNAKYPITCKAEARKLATGACATGDAGKFNCLQNYSAGTAVTVAGRPTGTCAEFANGKIAADAVINDAGHEPKCDITVADSVKKDEAGFCGTIAGCTETYSASSAVADGIPAAGKTCQEFAVAAKKLAANTVLDNTTKAITCSAAANGAESSKDGLCPSPVASDWAYCTRAPEKAGTAKTLTGSPTGATCAAFASGKLPSGAIYDASGAYALSCTPATATSIEVADSASSITYGSTVFPGYAPKKDEVCSQSLKDYVKNKENVPVATSCTIVSVSNSSYSFDNKQCPEVTTALSTYCSSSNGVKRNCDSGTNFPAGTTTNPNLSVQAYDGTFTCDTPCSQTGFCKVKAGTVRDNYKECATSPLTDTQGSVLNKQLGTEVNQCAVGKKRVVVKGPYREIATDVIRHVAGAPSESGTTNALASYVRARSQDIFGATLPSVSVFVHQDASKLGQNGSVGKAYNDFATMMSGQKRPVLSTADQYATSLQSLSGMIREKLERSFKVAGVKAGQAIHRIWHRKAGETGWTRLVDQSNWTASGGTVTFNADYAFEFGDEFQVEYF